MESEFFHSGHSSFDSSREETFSSSSHSNAFYFPQEDVLQGIWVLPTFDPSQITTELERKLAGEGEHIEQSYLYWDHKSARDWLNIVNRPDYRLENGNLPYKEIADEIAWTLQETFGPEKKHLGIIAMSPKGDGSETGLVQELVRHHGLIHHIQLDFLDLSQPLLVNAYKEAKQVLQDNPRVSIWAVQGDMSHLAQYDQLLQHSTRRPCLITMMGGTLQTLQNEPLFIENNLASCKNGDLLLIHVSTTYAPIDKPEEIHKKDPRLSQKKFLAWEESYKKFLTGPLRRHYQEELQEVHIKSILNTEDCHIPQSYAVELYAQVKLNNNINKEFNLMRFVRYQKNELILALAEKGWLVVDTWDTGPTKDQCVYLFRKS